MENYLVSTSPHVTNTRTTKDIMRDVFIALIPALLASIFVFGFYPLVVCLLSTTSAVLAEFLFNKMRKKPQTIGDWSAAVTGLLLGLNLPPVIPLYVPIIGSFFAIMVVKMLFGGLGKNFANPAITARIFLVLSWGTLMTTWVAPIDLSKGFYEMFRYFTFMNPDNVVTSATPLGISSGSVDTLAMFLGNVGGSAGETSALALMIGGIYLMVRKVIKPTIPVIYIATVGLLTLCITQDIKTVLPAIFGGGLMIGAFFMATDYSTSPNTKLGTIIYALGLGILTVVIRIYGELPEGVSFAILLMNIATPLLDKYIVPKPFGYKKPVKEKKEKNKKLAKEAE